MEEEYIDVVRAHLAIIMIPIISMYSSLRTLYTVNARSNNIPGRIILIVFLTSVLCAGT